MNQTGKAYIATLVYTAIIGFSFLFVKISLTTASPLDTLAHRFTISLLAALIPVAFGKIKLSLGWKDLLAILPIALLYPAGFFLFQTFGLAYTTSSAAGIIQACIPVFTLVMAASFLKEHSTLQQKLAILLSTGGVVFIFIMQGVHPAGASLLGSFLILLSSLSSAGYSVLVRRTKGRYSPFELAFVTIAFGFIVFNVSALIQHQASGTLSAYFEPLGDSSFLMSVLYLGIAASLGSALLSNYALSVLKASQVSVFINLATVITMTAGVLFLDERLFYYDLIGAAVIIAGVVFTQIRLFPAAPEIRRSPSVKRSL